MFICRHREAVERAFNIYDRPVERHEFSSLSLQGSRANSGLRVLTSVLQPAALAQRIEGEAALGDTLRRLLQEAGWEIVNRTPLPVVCTVHPAMRAGAFSAADAVQHLRAEGVLAWAEALRPGEPEAVRLGIISRRTTEDSLRFVVERLAAFVAERGYPASPRERYAPPGCQPGGASSKPSNSKAGATVQPTRVQAPSGRALCQAPTGTTTCGHAPSPTPSR